MAAHAINLGVKDEAVVAASLLHNVCGDCGVEVEELPIESSEVKKAVRLLTYIKPVPLDAYYHEISKDRVASIVKLLDRCDSVSTMSDVFTPEEIWSYIQETTDFVMPLYRSTKEHWPEQSSALFVLKYHILSVIDGLAACLPDEPSLAEASYRAAISGT